MVKKNDRFSISNDSPTMDTLGLGTSGYLSVVREGQGNRGSDAKDYPKKFGTQLEDQIRKWQDLRDNPAESKLKQKEQEELEYWEDAIIKARMLDDSDELTTLPCLVEDPDWEPTKDELSRFKNKNQKDRRAATPHIELEFPVPNKYVIIKYEAWNLLIAEKASGGLEFSVYPVHRVTNSEGQLIAKGISMGRYVQVRDLRNIVDGMLQKFSSLKFFVDWHTFRHEGIFLIDDVQLGSKVHAEIPMTEEDRQKAIQEFIRMKGKKCYDSSGKLKTSDGEKSPL